MLSELSAIASIVAVGLSLLTLIYKRGGSDIEARRTSVEIDRRLGEHIENTDQRIGVLVTASQFNRDQLAEAREMVATRFATKDELRSAESRFESGTSRIMDRLDRLDNRFDDLKTSLITAVNKIPRS